MKKVLRYFTKSVTSGANNLACRPKHAFRLMWAEVKINTAPSTSQDFTVTKDAGDGDTYDNVLFTRDLSVGSVTDLHKTFGEGFEYEKDDEIDLAFGNNDNRTVVYTVCVEMI